MIERHTEFPRTGTQRTERAYGVSSLSAAEAVPARLLELNRGHWEIEDRVHYVRDVSFDQDRSRIRAGTRVRLMASMRNLVISILRLLGFSYVPEGLRYFAMRIDRIFALLGI